MYCTCICKEGRRVAPDGSPQNVSKLKIEMSLNIYFFKANFLAKTFKKKKELFDVSSWCIIFIDAILEEGKLRFQNDYKKLHIVLFRIELECYFQKWYTIQWNLKITCY